jgi:soluble lytic murein transglycosylase-like protein
MTETSGGKVRFGDKQLLKKGIKKASYGIMQVRLGTARFVAKEFGLKDVSRMSDLSLIKNLIHNNLFNAKIAVLYIVWCSNHSKSYFETVSRYNGGRVNHAYYNRVQKNLKLLKKHNL